MRDSSEQRQPKSVAAQPAAQRNQSASIVDRRASAAAHLQLKQKMDERPADGASRALKQLMSDDETAESAALLDDEDETLQGKFAASPSAQAAPNQEARPNNTGLPDNLKAGIESLSGMSMDHVNVHYNSDKPAQLQAHAYAQGSEIHVGPGQEQHLPHEAWHVVQQAQGRVRPTMQMKQGVQINDDLALEAEADVMGAMAISSSNGTLHQYSAAQNLATVAVQRMEMTATGAFPAVNTEFAVDQPVFINPNTTSLNVQIPIDPDDAPSNVNLYFGQNYLNDELSKSYYGDAALINSGKATIAWDLEDPGAVIRDGHHRVVWGLYHQKTVEFQLADGRDTRHDLSDVRFRGTPQPVVIPPQAEEQKISDVQG